MAVADFDGDGRPDLAVANPGDDSISVLLGSGDGTFQPAPSVFAHPSFHAAAADVDGDGRADLLYSSFGGVWVLPGNGDGTFRTTHDSYIASGMTGAVLLADFNGDSLPDVATGNAITDDVAVLLNAGDWPATVAGARVFYNNSALDGNDPAAGAADDAAVAADKHPLRPGEAPTAVNVTNYARGINGIMIDIAGLPPAASIAPDNFVLDQRAGASWARVHPAPQVAVRRGAGTGGSDRVTLTFADDIIRNTWLRVTVLNTLDTGLAAKDVFYFGNLAGDTGNDRSTPVVNTTDIARTRAAVGKNDAASLNRYDFNRDGKINAADVLIVRNNQRHVLPLFGAPAAPAPAARTFTIPVSPRAPTRPPRRGVLDTAEPPLLA
jgi:hypothetical protein